MRLFVDDTRMFPPVGYECCRSAESAMLMLSIMPFDEISLDYSLGIGAQTGLDILRWMKEKNIRVPVINIHSNHALGREKMREYAEENFPESEVTANMLPK